MKQLLLLLALPVLAFSACSKDDNDDDSTDKGIPLIARRVFFQEPAGNSDDLQYSYDDTKRCTLISGVILSLSYNYPSATEVTSVTINKTNQDTIYRTMLLKDGWVSDQYYRKGNNGPVIPERVYERNPDHSVKRQTNYSTVNAAQISTVEEYEYDADGHRTRALNYNSSGALQHITTYEYDKSLTNTINGENFGVYFINTPNKSPFLHSIQKDVNGVVMQEINYTYEKDAQGRITKAIWTYVVPAGKKETHSYTYR